MKIIDSYVGITPKLSGTGNIKYRLWVDDTGGLFIQIIENDASGTYSKFAFSVSQYQSQRDSANKLGQLDGYAVEDNQQTTIDDNNNGAFLKAALTHLLGKKVTR